MSINKSKHIAVICNYKLRPDRIGGMDRFFVDFNNKAIQEGYIVVWYVTGYNGFDFYKELNINVSVKQPLETYVLQHIIQNKVKYDIVITHFTELCTSFYKQIKQLTNAYCIAVDHNPRPLNGFSLKKRIKLRTKGFLFGKYINKVVGVSPYCKVHLKKDYGSAIRRKTIIIYNGIETKLYLKKNNFNTQNRFVVACHLRQEKGVQDIITAIGLLNTKSLDKLKLDIYGEGDYEAHLKKQVKELNLEKYISFKGSRDDLHNLYCQYDYLLHASHGETFCFTVVESLVSNLPVITTKQAGNILGLVNDRINGFLFDIKDVNKLADLMKDILDGRGIIKNSKIDRTISTQFSITDMTESYIQLIKSLK